MSVQSNFKENKLKVRKPDKIIIFIIYPIRRYYILFLEITY